MDNNKYSTPRSEYLLSVRISNDLRAHIVNVARAGGISFSQCVRMALILGVADLGKALSEGRGVNDINDKVV